MFILVFSDTHGNVSGMKTIISNYPDVDLIIHLGDCEKDVFKVRGSFPHIPFEYVAGNNDWSSDAPDEKILNIVNKKIFITHGHRYGVKSTTKGLVSKGHEVGADVVLFGHTHLADEFYSDKMLVINPGSLGSPSVYQGPTFCELLVEDDSIKAHFKAVI